jgi:hypothetical protein
MHANPRENRMREHTNPGKKKLGRLNASSCNRIGGECYPKVFRIRKMEILTCRTEAIHSGRMKE